MLPVQYIFRMEKEGRMSHEQQTTLPIHYFGKSGLALLKLPFVMVFVLCVCCMHGAIGCGLCLLKAAVTLPH